MSRARAKDDPTEPRPTPSSRRFTILDLLISIVPLAVAIVATREFVDHDLDRARILRMNQSWPMMVIDGFTIGFFGLFPRYEAAAMVAFFLMRLRRPRPCLRRLSREPGAVACAAASAAVLAGGVVVLSRKLFGVPEFTTMFDVHNWTIIESRVGPAVVAAWAVLYASGRWRPEPSWLDRAGRLLGAFWIALWFGRWYLILTNSM
jgi:hypothetical protein